MNLHRIAGIGLVAVLTLGTTACRLSIPDLPADAPHGGPFESGQVQKVTYEERPSLGAAGTCYIQVKGDTAYVPGPGRATWTSRPIISGPVHTFQRGVDRQWCWSIQLAFYVEYADGQADFTRTETGWVTQKRDTPPRQHTDQAWCTVALRPSTGRSQEAPSPNASKEPGDIGPITLSKKDCDRYDQGRPYQRTLSPSVPALRKG